MDNVFVLAIDQVHFLDHLISEIKRQSMCIFILVNFDKFSKFLDPKHVSAFKKIAHESTNIILMH
jgi:hypothetical protein